MKHNFLFLAFLLLFGCSDEESNPVSPSSSETCTVEKNDSITTITCPDGNTAEIKDGVDGTDGTDGSQSNHTVEESSLFFPDGVDGDPIIEVINLDDTYTVPQGKTLYVTSWGYHLRVNGCPANSYSNQVIIVPESGLLSANTSNVAFSGFLIDKGVEAFTTALSGSESYTVPFGKTLYITSSYGNILFDDVKVSQDLSSVAIASEGTVIKAFTSASNPCNSITGYFK